MNVFIQNENQVHTRTKINITQFFFFFSREDGKVKFLTKGDNNSVDDRGLYAPGQLWLEKKDVVGRARG